MRAKEIMAEQFAKAKMPCKDTVDTLKAGSAEREVKKLATCFIATPEVIRAAADWGGSLPEKGKTIGRAGRIAGFRQRIVPSSKRAASVRANARRFFCH